MCKVASLTEGHVLQLVGALGSLSKGTIGKHVTMPPRLVQGPLETEGPRMPGVASRSRLPSTSAPSDGTGHPVESSSWFGLNE